jgi:hypothetical protein
LPTTVIIVFFMFPFSFFWFYVKAPEKPVMAALRKTWDVALKMYI